MGAGAGATGRSRPLDDLDVVRHAGDAIHARDVVEREVALVLEVDVALERDPAVLDVDVEVVARDLGVPAQPLQSRAADLRVLPAVLVEQSYVELVQHVDDAARAPGVGHGGPLLGEAADGPPEGHRGDLVGVREARVARQLGANVVDDPAVGEIHCGSPCPPPWVDDAMPARGGCGRADSPTVFVRCRGRAKTFMASRR
jgi:hypothetical protein